FPNTFDVYFLRRITSSTRLRVLGSMGWSTLLMTRETVATETPASSAISAMVTVFLGAGRAGILGFDPAVFPSSVFTGHPFDRNTGLGNRTSPSRRHSPCNHVYLALRTVWIRSEEH